MEGLRGRENSNGNEILVDRGQIFEFLLRRANNSVRAGWHRIAYMGTGD